MTDEKPVEDKPVEPIPETEAPGLIDQANSAAERTEKAVADLKKENDRAEEIASKRMLAGKGSAGAPIAAPEDPEKVARRERIKAYGNASGAQWAKEMDKEDAKKAKQV